MRVDDAEVPKNVELYDFEDFDKHRELIFSDAKSALVKSFPREHNGVRIELDNVDYTDPETYSTKEQKKALHEDQYLGRRLRGTIVLKDTNTGETLDKKTITLMKVPWLTDRGTFIREGNEWGTISQQRLLPGAYSRVQANGDLETQFNVRPGTGGAFKVQFNPESAQYRFNIAGSDLHLYSLMKEIGVSDEQLKERWGEAVWAINAENYDSGTLEKAYNKIVPEWDKKNNPNRTREQKIELIKNALNRSQVATAVVKKTLPNLFSREKAAAWKESHELITKCASLKREDLQDIAAYINSTADKNIDIEGNKTYLIAAIKNVISTGLVDGDMSKGKIDSSDNSAALIRALKANRFLQSLKARINKPSKFLDKL
jgi:DNA-directed RNA polymerase beta subunit